jgi:hypothetical protein
MSDPVRAAPQTVPPGGAPRVSDAGDVGYERSLWREIADGTAGPVVRIGVSLALAALLAGAACIGSLVVAGWVPDWSGSWGTRFWPSDELLAGMFFLASLVYVLGLIWIWKRSVHHLHEFFKAGLMTLAASAIALVLCGIIETVAILRASDEILVAAVLCFGGGVVVLIWVQAGRRYARGGPMVNAEDGAPDVRCPTCGYRMVGLRECRCPECGSEHTVDQLLARQAFFVRRRPPAAVVAAENNGKGAGS